MQNSLDIRNTVVYSVFGFRRLKTKWKQDGLKISRHWKCPGARKPSIQPGRTLRLACLTLRTRTRRRSCTILTSRTGRMPITTSTSKPMEAIFRDQKEKTNDDSMDGIRDARSGICSRMAEGALR